VTHRLDLKASVLVKRRLAGAAPAFRVAQVALDHQLLCRQEVCCPLAVRISLNRLLQRLLARGGVAFGSRSAAGSWFWGLHME
jgi:hypothetical protein